MLKLKITALTLAATAIMLAAYCIYIEYKYEHMPTQHKVSNATYEVPTIMAECDSIKTKPVNQHE